MKQLEILDMMKNEDEKQKEDVAPENLVYSPISPNRAYRVVYTESDGDDQPGDENEDYYEEEEKELETMIQRICYKSIAECLAGFSEKIKNEVEGMTTKMLDMIKKMENMLVKSLEKQEKQNIEKLSRMEA